MSQENVEVVRAQYEAWSAGDMEKVASHYSHDALVSVPFWPDHPEPAVGLPAITEAFARARTEWDLYAVIGHDFVEHGDQVIVPTTSRLRGRGPEVTMNHTNVYTVRDGKIVRLDGFQDHAEALEAVGLAESALSEKNAEVVRRMVELFNRRDLGSLAELCQEDLLIESALTAANLGAGSYQGGTAAWPRYFADMDEAFHNWGIEEGFQLRDAGEDIVLCLCNLAGEGKTSGARVTRFVGIVFRLREWKVFRIRSYLDPAEALEAVGLSQ